MSDDGAPWADNVGLLQPADRATIPIDSLLPADSPRSAGESVEHIDRLAQCDDELPPILVHRGSMRVIDGMHRLRAAKLRGRTEIEVTFFTGTEEEAFLRAVESNTTHGLPLSLPDRKTAAERLMRELPELSDRGVARAAGLAARTVAGIRRRSTADLQQSNSRVGRDGRRRPVDAEARRRRVVELLEQSPEMSLRALAAAAGVSVSTAHAVRRRLREQQAGPHAAPGRDDDVATALHWLTRDPALRSTDQGRRLLRWLHMHTPREGDGGPGIVDAIPPHCLDAVYEVATRNADHWRDFAEHLGVLRASGNVTSKNTDSTPEVLAEHR